MNAIYTIESIRNLDGTPHEREARRKGQRVELLRYERGLPLLICYRDDYNKILRTSAVQDVLTSDEAETVAVYTKHTVYTFRKEGANHREEDAA